MDIYIYDVVNKETVIECYECKNEMASVPMPGDTIIDKETSKRYVVIDREFEYDKNDTLISIYVNCMIKE